MEFCGAIYVCYYRDTSYVYGGLLKKFKAGVPLSACCLLEGTQLVAVAHVHCGSVAGQNPEHTAVVLFFIVEMNG